MNILRIGTCICVAVFLAACGNQDAAHLVFGQKINVGLSVSATAPDQGGSLTLGFKSEDVAIVPVAIKKDSYEMLRAITIPSKGGQIRDSFSTLGQFDMDAGKEGGTVRVGLGKFFATGNAAQRLSEGFRRKLGGIKSSDSSRERADISGNVESTSTTTIEDSPVPEAPEASAAPEPNRSN